MARKPAGVDTETWRKQRDEVWRWRNRLITGLMVAAIVVLVLRYFMTS
jgi:CHASE2 domain-containing sensor protein